MAKTIILVNNYNDVDSIDTNNLTMFAEEIDADMDMWTEGMNAKK